MVREELVARQVLDYAASYKTAAAAINDLNRKMPWAAVTRIPNSEIERAKDYWRDQYEEVLLTLDTSSENTKTALAREAYCEKPAKTNPDAKGGARDVAIWLSVIDYLRGNPEEEVFFVTANVRDFGDGTSYPDPMADDLGDMAPRLHRLESFEEFISQFTEPIDIDEERVKGLLESLVSDSLTPIETSASSVLRDGRFEGTKIEDGVFEALQWSDWLLPPSAVIRNVIDVSGHKIADAEWYTATVNWILVGVARPSILFYKPDISAFARIACEWRTKVLFSTGPGQRLAIVDYESPRALDPNDRAELQPLLETALTASVPAISSFFAALIAQLSEAGLAPATVIKIEPWQHGSQAGPPN